MNHRPASPLFPSEKSDIQTESNIERGKNAAINAEILGGPSASNKLDENSTRSLLHRKEIEAKTVPPTSVPINSNNKTKRLINDEAERGNLNSAFADNLPRSEQLFCSATSRQIHGKYTTNKHSHFLLE